MHPKISSAKRRPFCPGGRWVNLYNTFSGRDISLTSCVSRWCWGRDDREHWGLSVFRDEWYGLRGKVYPKQGIRNYTMKHNINVFKAYHDDVIKWKIFPCNWPFVRGNPPMTGGFPSQRPVTWSFHAYFDLRLNKWLTKQPGRRRFDTPSRSVWRHCNDICNFIFAWKEKQFHHQALYQI